MPASMSRMSAADAVGAGGAAPSPPAGVTLAVGYNAKRCRFCLRWSTETSPTPAACYPAWETLVPWGRGTLMKPLGFACKLCVVVPSPTYQLTCVLLTCHSLCSAVIHHMSPSLPAICEASFYYLPRILPASTRGACLSLVIPKQGAFPHHVSLNTNCHAT
jgi:hypothetical protein